MGRRALAALLLLASAQACTHDADCGSMHVCSDGSCKHKNLFPLEWPEYIGTLLIFLLLGMANASGLGGGVIMIPILMTVFQFGAHTTVALSLTIATVGAATAYFSKASARRPKSPKPLVDYEVAMIMQPGMLLGTVYGVMLNVVMPSWLLLVLLTGLLVFMCYNSAVKCVPFRGVKVFKAESAQMNAANLLAKPEEPTQVAEEPLLPWVPLGSLVIIYVVALGYAFSAGGKNTSSVVGISVCTAGYWLLLAGYSALCLLFLAFFAKVMLWKMKREEELGVQFVDGDMLWTPKSVIGVGICGVAAGLAGAMLGIGGGVIIGPLLLNLNVNAQTTAATAIFMVFFGASISAIQYIVAGILNAEYALFFLVVGVLGSLFGVVIVKWLVDKYKRSSIIIFVLAGILGISSIVLPVYNGYLMYEQSESGKLQLGFSSFCD